MFWTFMSLFFFSCRSQLFLQGSSQFCLRKRTDRLIEKSHKNVDTVYLYSVAFNNFNLVWYHKDGFIYWFQVKPYKTKRYKPYVAQNIAVNSDSVDKYFDTTLLYKDIECFKDVLDGEWIALYVKEKSRMFSSINTDCLFRNKYPVNSFPYKLQYDFSKILRYKDFDFEKVYSE